MALNGWCFLSVIHSYLSGHESCAGCAPSHGYHLTQELTVGAEHGVEEAQ